MPLMSLAAAMVSPDSTFWASLAFINEYQAMLDLRATKL
jgi:hypothetical protein